MNKRLILLCLMLLTLAVLFPASAKGKAVTASPLVTTAPLLVIDLSEYGYQPLSLPDDPHPNPQSPTGRGGGSNPANPYAVIRKAGPTYARPGASVQYAITLANYESITHTYRLTDTLSAQLAYVPDPAGELTYNPAAHTLTWQGALAPGHLDYLIEESALALPYLDLADFGAANLCDEFTANDIACANVAVTFNLGVNGYTTNLYGEIVSQLTVSSNGLLLAGAGVADSHNQWLPDPAAPNFLLAGLWRDVDLTDSGRWHAAIISGLVQGHDVFYAQWHDAPHASDADLTARHAIAVLLSGDGDTAGQAFFIYDNISDPAQTVAQGYTIGVEDRLGVRGVTYAYAPCCDDPQPPQGYPPPAGTTLQLRPVLFGADNEYARTFRYTAIVNAPVPQTLANTAAASSTSTNPSLANVWATHYLYVRFQSFIPGLRFAGVTP